MKVIRFLLFPISWLYDLITSLRNFLFDLNILKSVSFDIPVVCVGNVSVGGTGKTPQVEYLVELLKDNYTVAILSRGYRRKTKGFVLVDDKKTVEDVGDEPFQYYSKYPQISVAVCENRVEGIRELIHKVKPDVILLDDAFQHRWVRPSFSILLTKWNDLFLDDFLLPTGNLRESRRAAKRADAIVVTKCPDNMSNKQMDDVLGRLLRYERPVFFSGIGYDTEIKGSKKMKMRELKDYQVLLITGIANPGPLLSYMEIMEISITHLKYPDHHFFKQGDVDKIVDRFKNLKGEKNLILTTEKDYVRLKNKIEGLCYLPIQTTFLVKEEQQTFDDLLLSHIDAKQ